jgi:oligopeptide/dipeptide ABC transporter ATP-binding protein
MPRQVDVTGLTVHYPLYASGIVRRQRGHVSAAENVSFTIERGETLGLVGESGSGKTTVGRALLGAAPVSGGRFQFAAESGIADVFTLSAHERRHLRRDMQMIFQDPYASLNPRMTVRDIIAESLVALKIERSSAEINRRVAEIADRCGLSREQLGRYPHAFSGGQRQRIAIARAIVTSPRFVVCDEPISALDVSIQAQILNLLRDLQADLHLTYLFIAHDLAAVAYVCDRVALLYLGEIVEIGRTRDVYFTPRHPYTEALMSAVPEPDPDVPLRPLLMSGERPDPANPPAGCRFHTRCRYATDLCRREKPALRPVGAQSVACHYAETLALTGAVRTPAPPEPVNA